MQVGDKVTWTSQSKGFTKKKKGTIVRVVNIDEGPAAIAHDEFPGHKRMFTGYDIPPGYWRAYLIEVIPGPRARPRLYMPYPKHLKLLK